MTAIALAAVWNVSAGTPPDDAPITPREQQLWGQITALTQADPTTRPLAAWFDAVRQQRRELLERVRLYLALYPGGAHRDQAIRLELSSLFELGTLAGGAMDPLHQRIGEILHSPPSEAAAQEAAYWAIVCRHRSRHSDAAAGPAHDWAGSDMSTRPATIPTMAWRRGASLWHPRTTPWGWATGGRRAVGSYIASYPRSPHVPRLASLLFEEAATRDDQAAMMDILDHLREHFPNHLATHCLEAEWRRRSAVGKPFWPRLKLADLAYDPTASHVEDKLSLQSRAPQGADALLDQQPYLGRPVLIVVWAGFDQSARRCAQAVEELRRGHGGSGFSPTRPALHAIGISLDETSEQTAAASRELGLSWPQFSDRLGWGGEFVRTWDIRSIPTVMVIDRTGKLLGSAGADDWEPLAREALGRVPR
jgi:hypothetical protein